MLSIVPAIAPSQLPAFSSGGGLISATGTPQQVTRIGSRVCRTRSSTARQVALNFEIEICSMNAQWRQL